jgi:2-amino-4-hydroxy-6-hydroxymethyldihydropteridine diphosphokinase
MERIMVTAYLGIGGNIGDRRETLAGARNVLDNLAGIQVVSSSPLYETEPVGGPLGQPLYLNAVLKIRTALDPEKLLQCCLSVESRFGRRRDVPCGPRTLDVDLLFYGAEVRRGKNLIVPPPRLHQRSFVLAPLRDVAPELMHPLLERTVSELYSRLQPAAGVERWCESW